MQQNKSNKTSALTIKIKFNSITLLRKLCLSKTVANLYVNDSMTAAFLATLVKMTEMSPKQVFVI